VSRRLIARVGLVKVYRDPEWNEFAIVNPDNTTAYESDKPAALGTAPALARFFGVPSGRGRSEQPILTGASYV
jgi:hypothetical protein